MESVVCDWTFTDYCAAEGDDTILSIVALCEIFQFHTNPISIGYFFTGPKGNIVSM